MNWIDALLYSPVGSGKNVVVYCNNILTASIIKSENYNTTVIKDIDGNVGIITKWFYLEV